MQLLAHIWSVTFPFFGLVLCGYLATRNGWIVVQTIPGLNYFVLYLALPAMLLRFAAITPIASLLAPGIVVTYLLCAMCMVWGSLLVHRPGNLGWNDASFVGLVAAFPNSGFMGVPLLVALCGDSAAAPVIVALSLDMVVTSSLCIALSRIRAQGSADAGRAVRQALLAMTLNPLPWSIGLGSLISATQMTLPHPLQGGIDLLAQSASPMALFTLGCVLARTQQTMTKDTQTQFVEVCKMVGQKLLLHPLLVAVISGTLNALGLPLDPYSAMVLVLVAALPSASNVPMLAERFGADGGRLAFSVMGSTVLSFLTFTAVVMMAVPPALLLKA